MHMYTGGDFDSVKVGGGKGGGKGWLLQAIPTLALVIVILWLAIDYDKSIGNTSIKTQTLFWITFIGFSYSYIYSLIAFGLGGG